MFPQNEGNENEPHIMYGEIEEEESDYSHVTKHPYTSKVFCWIQNGESQQVIKFFDTFPHLINQFSTPNNWNPFMYAVRYANMELIQYFSSKNMKTTVTSVFSHVSMIHSAVYSGEIKILRHVLTKMNCSPNPPNSEVSPLKIAMKVGNAKMVELLISKGSYYAFGDVYNNIEPKTQQNTEQNSKYASVINPKETVSNNSVVEDTAIKDCPIKETLRWARIRQLMHLTKHAKENPLENNVESKFDSMHKILSNNSHFSLILKMCIGNGESILKSAEVIEEPRDREESRKEGKQKK